jgi:hypothetical protein
MATVTPLPFLPLAEQHVLGTILLVPSKLPDVDLRPHDFHNPAHAAIWQAMIDLHKAGEPIDQIVLGSHMQSNGSIERLRGFNGEAYFSELTSAVTTVENVGYHAGLIRTASIKRRALEGANRLQQAAQSDATPDDLADLLDGLAREIAERTKRTRKAVPTMSISDIPDPGPTRWLVEHLWQEGAFGLVAAEPKALKSYLTLQIAISVAAGRKLFNRFAIPNPGPILMFSAEGGKGLIARRARSMARAMGIDLALLDFQIIDLAVLRLDDRATVGALLSTVEEVRPRLILLDPLRELHGGDENDSAAVAALLAPLRQIQHAHPACAVMVVHHMSKSPADGKNERRPGQRVRGSGAFHGSTESSLYLSVKGEGEEKRVTVEMEHKDAATIDPFILALRTATRDDGDLAWLEIVDGPVRTGERDKVLAAIANARTPLKSKNAIFAVAKGDKSRTLTAIDELESEGLIAKENGVYVLCEGGADA